jgi:hypothetical protein
VDQVIRLLALLALWFVQTTIDQYNALIGQTLSRGKSSGNVATGGQLNLDAPVGGSDVVTLEASLAAAGAAGDLGVLCFPYAADGVTLLTTPLPAVAGIGYPPTLASGVAAAVQQYNVQGIDKVQFQVKNNNAATKTVTASWRVENN